MLLAGLAFKAGTDDLRESPNGPSARNLLREGYKLSIFDPSVDAGKLVGANLGYAWSFLPQIASLLVTKADAETCQFDRVIFANRTARLLSFPATQPVLDIGSLGSGADSLPSAPDKIYAGTEEPAASQDLQRAVA